jgi:hypothetical protein
MVSYRRNGIYRSIVIAALGWLSLVGGGPGPEKNAQSKQPASQSTVRGKVVQPIFRTPEPPIASSPDTGCKKGRDKRQSDLCAQWKAADAAWDAARADESQLFVGWIGLILGFVTMGAAIAAAVYAKRAAVATEETVGIARDGIEGAAAALAIAERNANAAQKLVETNVDSSRRELRAYITISAIQIETLQQFKRPKATVTISNAGKTPAHNVQTSIRIGWREYDFDESTLEMSPPNDFDQIFSVGPDNKIITHCFFPDEWNDDFSERLRLKFIKIVVFGVITYSDVFGMRHEATIRSYHDADTPAGLTLQMKSGNTEI